MNIVISPFSQAMRNGKRNPKNYPWWPELIALLKDNHIIYQIGVPGEEAFVDPSMTRFGLSFAELKELTLSVDTFIAVDNFYPHFCNHYGKHGIVLFSKSDPKLFGYPENKNLYVSQKHFRPDQFGLWESCDHSEEAFVSPHEVYSLIG